jgi:hypothetical protein
MQGEQITEDLRQELVKAKDFDERKFNLLTENFYVIRSALRYYSVKKGKSFTSSMVADNFPVSTPVAGACMNILDELDVVQPRTESKSPDRYLPKNIDMERLKEFEEVLLKSYEIRDFWSPER